MIEEDFCYIIVPRYAIVNKQDTLLERKEPPFDSFAFFRIAFMTEKG